ncbi:hypothetical protein B5M42_021790 [Paenibacillus athensensis]|uniref:Chemotaxis protein CheX n=1 Tax=Paenibacillus athensensis TaxID=1967502 RepID=A0A4Y8PWK6_9BACL|nr:hypothetical protein [Paenibacillus athensensis]MCD1261438.1 hypothetical protein [Paenibacillus athensensis]
MFTQYFGHFLLNRGIVSAHQLQSAMDQLQSTHVKLGILSVNAGYMTAEQALEVHQAQARVDKRFGEIALELGYLNEDQLNNLLSAQKESHLLLGQALIDQEALTLGSFTAALNEYKQEHYLSDEQFEAIKNGDIDVLLATMLKFEDIPNIDLHRHYISLLAKNLIRFIDPNIYFEVNAIPRDYQCEWLVSQQMTGEVPLASGFSLGEMAFLQIASAYAEEQLTELDAIARDAVGEFLNLHNGLFLVNMSGQGLELELQPQVIEEQVPLPPTVGSYLLTVYLSGSSFDLILSEITE